MHSNTEGAVVANKHLSLEDDLAIRNLMGKYQWCVDGGDSEGWADCFTEDGAFIGGLPDPYHGREELKKIPELVRNMYQDRMRHLMGSFWAEYGDGQDEAYARFYSLVTTWLDNEDPKLFQCAICTVHLVRVEGDWKVKSNNVKNLKQN